MFKECSSKRKNRSSYHKLKNEINIIILKQNGEPTRKMMILRIKRISVSVNETLFIISGKLVLWEALLTNFLSLMWVIHDVPTSWNDLNVRRGRVHPIRMFFCILECIPTFEYEWIWKKNQIAKEYYLFKHLVYSRDITLYNHIPNSINPPLKSKHHLHPFVPHEIFV